MGVTVSPNIKKERVWINGFTGKEITGPKGQEISKVDNSNAGVNDRGKGEGTEEKGQEIKE